jgi:hypothetical protein
MASEIEQLKEQLRLSKLETRKWRLAHDNQRNLKRALTERSDLKERAPAIARLEQTVTNGIIPGFIFTVSNDGGKTGIFWRESLVEVMEYFEPHASVMTDYAVVAVRKP